MESVAGFMEMVNAFRESRIILSAHELGIFTMLGNKSRTSADLAGEIKTDKRATDRLMNALVSIGLLEKSGERFRNTSFSQKFLVSDSPAFIGALSHTAATWRTWNTLTEAVRRGKTVTMDQPISEREDIWLKNFIAAMHSRGGKQATEVADVLDLSDTHRILDVGGGSGVVSFEFVRRAKDATAVIFDLPEVIPLTQEYILKAGMKDRVSTAAGDYLVTDLGKGFDLVYISAVIHINNPVENLNLLKKAANALIPGGQLVIMDHIMNEERTEPAMGAIFALTMLVGTMHGDTYTESEIRSWMEAAGLTEIRHIDTAEGTNLMIAKKV